MELENIATPPPTASPQSRYATLHRAVERGLASDEVWYDLAQVCLQLGHDEEAVRTWRMMSDGASKNRLHSQLARRGLIDPPVRRSRRDEEPQLPAVSGASPGLEPEAPPRLIDHLYDALHFLMQERMPLLVLTSMLAFPLVVGLGGFLTAGGSPFLLPAIAALPGLCVLGMVGALGRRVLVDAARGEEMPPSLPELGQLTRQATRWLSDTGLIVLAMLGPSVLMFALSAPWISAVPGLVLGGFFLPMALALRQVRDDWRALSLRFLLTAIGRTCSRYVGIVAAFWAMFLPAAVLIVGTTGMKVWLQIAAIGPFMVLPVFTTARMLGTFLDAQRIPLGVLLGDAVRRRQPVDQPLAPRATANPGLGGRPRLPKPPSGIARSKGATRAAAAAPAPAAAPANPSAARPSVPQARVSPPNPAPAPQRSAPPVPQRNQTRPTAPAPQARQPQPQRTPPPRRTAGATDAPGARPDGRAAARQPRSATPKPRPAAPSPRRTSREPASPPPPPPADLDLPQGLQGFTIVTGADRERMGAAARRD